jgi:drug/metabolite transporter (DMT)-like permease
MVTLICAAINGPARAENPETYIYAVFFGVFWVIAILFLVLNMSMGPTGLVLLFFSFGIIIPIIVDLTILRSVINIFQIVGIALLFISFYLGNRPDPGEKKGISLKFIVFCIIGFVFNGSVMATAKLHQGVMPGVDVEVFLTFGFAISVLTSLILFVFFHIKESKNERISYTYMFKSPKYYLSAFGSAVTTAIGNILMLVIAGQVPAAIQFPLMNGGTSLLTAVLSIFIFKEKFTKKTAIVFIVGIAALAIINL